jgi:hypothetical protein
MFVQTPLELLQLRHDFAAGQKVYSALLHDCANAEQAWRKRQQELGMYVLHLLGHVKVSSPVG